PTGAVSMPDEPTCGKGLAASAALPARLSELTAAMAQILEQHMTALDLSDEASRREHDVYGQLVREHRANADALAATARLMLDQGELPMGRHDMARMAAPAMADAFERFVTLETELLQLLEARLEE